MLEVWQFQVEVFYEDVKQTFTAQTDTTWEEFLENVYNLLSGPHSDVQLEFQLGETGQMSCLASEQDWAIAIDGVCAK